MDVLLVEDHPIVRMVMRPILQSAIEEAVIHDADNLEKALQRSGELENIGLVLLDLGLPDCDGIETLARFKASRPALRVVVLSASDDNATVNAALDAGAVGYIPKTSGHEIIVAALKLVANGGTYIPPEARPSLRPRSNMCALKRPQTLLTERQFQVLGLIVKGLQNRQIAAELRISESTVKQHIHTLFSVLRVSSRLQAISASGQCGVRSRSSAPRSLSLGT